MPIASRLHRLARPLPPVYTAPPAPDSALRRREAALRSMLLLCLGLPIPAIILVALFVHA